MRFQIAETQRTTGREGEREMVKNKNEKWLLVVTDKDHEYVVFNNTFLKPSLSKIKENAKILMFYGMEEEIDTLYGKLKSANREQELVSLFVGEVWEKDMPGGLNEVLKAAFGDKENETSSAQNP